MYCSQGAKMLQLGTKPDNLIPGRKKEPTPVRLSDLHMQSGIHTHTPRARVRDGEGRKRENF